MVAEVSNMADGLYELFIALGGLVPYTNGRSPPKKTGNIRGSDCPKWRTRTVERESNAAKTRWLAALLAFRGGPPVPKGRTYPLGAGGLRNHRIVNQESTILLLGAPITRETSDFPGSELTGFSGLDRRHCFGGTWERPEGRFGGRALPGDLARAGLRWCGGWRRMTPRRNPVN